MSILINCLAVGAGGMLGAVGRYLLCLLPFKHSSGFPLTTLLVNVLGAFCIGLIFALAQKNGNMSPQFFLFLKVGLCGGFTTFSAFSLETMSLLQGGQFGIAVVYIGLSVVLCLIAVFGGQLLVK